MIKIVYLVNAFAVVLNPIPTVKVFRIHIPTHKSKNYVCRILYMQQHTSYSRVIFDSTVGLRTLWRIL